ncbi:hypothetical protein GCM10027060_26440 [Nesterenkonia halophila]
MPTPSKGDRTLVTARISQDHFTKLDRYVKAAGISKNDFIADLVVEALDDIDLDDVEHDQERLPLSA